MGLVGNDGARSHLVVMVVVGEQQGREQRRRHCFVLLVEMMVLLALCQYYLMEVDWRSLLCYIVVVIVKYCRY